MLITESCYDILPTMELEKDQIPKQVINKPIEEMKQGDVVVSKLLLDWRFVAEIPKSVAEFWYISEYSDTLMNDQGTTPNEQKIGYWQEGYGVVVGKSVAYPDEYRLNLLYKGTRGFSLYQSKDIFPETSE